MLTFNGPSSILYLPDEAINSTFEVVMPSLDLGTETGVRESKKNDGIFSTIVNTVKKIATSRYYTPIVESIEFSPLQTLSVDSSRVRDMYITAPTDQDKLPDAKIKIYCSSSMTAYYYFACWHNLIYNNEYECFNSYSTYTRDIVVYYYGHDDLATAQFTLKGCFPKTFPKISLDYSEDKRIVFDCDFNVDRIIQNDNVKEVALAKEYAAHVATNLIDNIIPSYNGEIISGAVREIFN